MDSTDGRQGPQVDVDADRGVVDDRDAHQILPYEADDSPFPEVRAVVSPVDDPSLPVNTVRMWCIGLLFTVVGIPIQHVYDPTEPLTTSQVGSALN